MTIFTSRRFWVAVISLVLMVVASLAGQEDFDFGGVAEAIVDLAWPIIGLISALLASYGLRNHA